MASAAFALIGFPLDDVWHRIFGQDVTLWGPTHLMLIGGAGADPDRQRDPDRRGPRRESPTSPRRSSRPDRRQLARWPPRVRDRRPADRPLHLPGRVRLRRPAVPARARADHARLRRRRRPGRARGSGSAPAPRSAPPLFFIVDPRRDRADRRPGARRDHARTSRSTWPRRSASSCVALAGLDAGARTRSAPSPALLIGTVGFFAEYAWSHVWMPVPWPESLIGEAILPGARRPRSPPACSAPTSARSFAAAGARRRAVRARPRDRPRGRSRRSRSSPSSALNVGDQTPSGWSAPGRPSTESTPGPERTVDATVRLDPATLGDDAYWVQAIAWQGGGLVVDQLERGLARRL